jgi:hypothetical protein
MGPFSLPSMDLLERKEEGGLGSGGVEGAKGAVACGSGLFGQTMGPSSIYLSIYLSIYIYLIIYNIKI